MGGDKEDEEEKEEEKEVEGWEEGKGEGRARRKRDRNRVTKAERPTGELGRRKVTSGPLKEPQERGGKRRKRGRRGEEETGEESRTEEERNHRIPPIHLLGVLSCSTLLHHTGGTGPALPGPTELPVHVNKAVYLFKRETERDRNGTVWIGTSSFK